MITFNYDGCKQNSIKDTGISDSEIEELAKKHNDILDKMKDLKASKSLPILQLPFESSDLAEIENIANKVKNSPHIVILGTGGSSLGAQAMVQSIGWNNKGKINNDDKPNLHFFDNLDAYSLDSFYASASPKEVKIIAISKSGTTAETTLQLLSSINWFINAGCESLIKNNFIIITTPNNENFQNPLRELAQDFDIKTYDHDPKIGGRYSCLSNVGLLPAIIAGFDGVSYRAGAKKALEENLEAKNIINANAAMGALLHNYYLENKNITNTALMAYGDNLDRFTAWHVQLWAESLGKEGKGLTTLGVLGPVDQHSQLQLFRDGPNDKFYTIIMQNFQNKGPKISDKFQKYQKFSHLTSKTIGDLVFCQQKATAQSLINGKRPVRTINIDKADEFTMGYLMMHFILETIYTAMILEIDPFSQEAVEEGKILAHKYLKEIS